MLIAVNQSQGSINRLANAESRRTIVHTMGLFDTTDGTEVKSRRTSDINVANVRRETADGTRRYNILDDLLKDLKLEIGHRYNRSDKEHKLIQGVERDRREGKLKLHP